MAFDRFTVKLSEKIVGNSIILKTVLVEIAILKVIFEFKAY